MKAKFVNEERDFYTEDIKDTPLESPEFEEDDELYIHDDFATSLKNELKVPEYARRTVSFRVKGEPGVIDAVPMAQMKDGSFLMKVGNKFRKFRMNDIIEESFKSER